MFNVGDRVLAVWPVEEEWWYPGTVVAVDGELFDVRYDDGDQARLSAPQMKSLEINAGARVFGRWKGGGQYYPGRISTAAGEAIHILYDDGDQEDTVVAMVRVHQDDV